MTPQYLTILITESRGAIIFSRIMAPLNAPPPPQTPQYLTILMTERGGGGSAIFFCRILALLLLLLLILWGGGGLWRQNLKYDDYIFIVFFQIITNLSVYN